MSPRRPPLVRRLGLARRLAAGLEPARVAHAARCPPELLDRLLEEASFVEIVQGWRELLGLAPDARTRRLAGLAQLVLEEALERRSLPAALFTLVHAWRGRDPVHALTGGLERALERARAEAAPDAAAAPPEPRPDPAPEPLPATSPTAAARARPDRLAALCHRTGAALRAAIVVEQGRGALAGPLAPPATDDPLGAAVHALHRAADAARAPARPAAGPAGPAPAAPPAAPPPDRPRPAPALVDALTDRLVAKLAEVGPAGRLALERMDDRALDRLARQLLTRPPHPGPAQPHPAQPLGP